MPQLTRRNVLRHGLAVLSGFSAGTANTVVATTGGNDDGTQRANSSKQSKHHLLLHGGGANNILPYWFTISKGQFIQQSGDSGAAPVADKDVIIDEQDKMTEDGTRIFGQLDGSADAWIFRGSSDWELSFDVSGSPATIYLDGELWWQSGNSELQGQTPSEWPMGKYGPARTGATPRSTGPTQPVKVKWRFTPGTGVAHTPVVAGDTVYIATRPSTKKSDKKPDKKKASNLLAVDAATGKERWRFTQPTAPPGPPAVVGDTAYIATTDAESTLYAVDVTTGEERWRDTPKYEPTTYEMVAVAVANDTVYVGTNGTTTESVNKDDTPLANESEDQWVESSYQTRAKKRAVYAVDAASGKERWRHRHWTGGPMAPVVVDDTVYVGSLGPAGTVYALDAQSGKEKWAFTKPVGGTVAPAVANNTVYVGSLSTRGTVYAINASTGVERWRFNPEAGWTAAPTVVDGTVYTGGIGSAMYALDAQSGEKQWLFAQSIHGSPTVIGDTVYVGGTRKGRNYVETTKKDTKTETDPILFAVDATTGVERWRFRQPTQSIRTVAVAGNTLYVAGGTLYALE